MFRDDWVMGYTHSQTMHHNELVLTYRKWTLYILMGEKTDWTVMIIPSGSEDECTRIRSGVRHPMWYVLLDLIKVPTCKSHTCQWFPPKVLHKVVVSDTIRDDDDWFTNKVPQAPKSKVLFSPLSPKKKKLIPYRYERTNVCCCFFLIMSTRRCWVFCTGRSTV